MATCVLAQIISDISSWNRLYFFFLLCNLVEQTLYLCAGDLVMNRKDMEAILDRKLRIRYTNKIVVNFATKIGVTLTESDLSISHRNPGEENGRSSHTPIIVKFTRRGLRDKLFKARFQLKNITSKDIGYTRHPATKIFITENLTKRRREIHKPCLQMKKENNYKYLWTRYGKIFLRKMRIAKLLRYQVCQN